MDILQAELEVVRLQLNGASCLGQGLRALAELPSPRGLVFVRLLDASSLGTSSIIFTTPFSILVLIATSTSRMLISLHYFYLSRTLLMNDIIYYK